MTSKRKGKTELCGLKSGSILLFLWQLDVHLKMSPQQNGYASGKRVKPACACSFTRKYGRGK